MSLALEGFTANELSAIAALWRKQGRVLATSFTGASMLPAIAPGQTVEIDCGADAGVGEVAVFRLDGQVGVHRVVARGSDWLLTWGDANPLPDEPIEPACLIGRVRNVPAGPWSMRRGLLRCLVVGLAGGIGGVRRRVLLAYRLRAAWADGADTFAMEMLRTAGRRLGRSWRARA
jgi:hypothetical protein